MCGAVFTFPTVGGAAPAAMAGPAPGGTSPFTGFDAAAGNRFSEPQAPAPTPRIFAILCPNGHTLQTPEDLLGTTSICPYCNKPVELLYENTVEYRRQQQAIAQQRDDVVSRFWIRIAVAATALVTATFVAMFVYIFKNR